MSEPDDHSWSRYHTAPVIDHSIAWIEENGEMLTGADDETLFNLAQELTEEAGFSEQDLAAVTAALDGSSLVEEEGALEGVRIHWDSAVPAATALRIESALAHLGVRNGDLSQLQSSVISDSCSDC